MAGTTRYMHGERVAEHASYVAEVAKAAFPYPNDEHPDRSWHVNLPQITVEVPIPGRKSVAPDIVVLEGDTRTAIFCGEVVENPAEIPSRAEFHWRQIATVSRLVVFVPTGTASESKKLLAQSRVDCLLYTYRWTPRGVEIAPVP